MSEALLTETFQANLATLQNRALSDLLAVWPSFNTINLERSFDAVQTYMAVQTETYREQAGTLAIEYLERIQELQSVESTYRPTPHKTDDVGLLVSMRILGPWDVKARIARGIPPELAMNTALAQMSGMISRHVFNGGRDLIWDAIQRDSQIVGYARVTRGSNPCAFCVMLSSRGFVYSSASAAGQSNKYHDNCNCVVMPTYRTDAQLPPSNEEHAKLWREVTRGYSGKEAINALRRYLNSPR